MAVKDVRRKLTDDESRAFHRMLTTIRRKTARNVLRTKYVDDKKRLDKIGFSVPPRMVDFQTPIGWARKGIVTPASRIRPDGFTLPRASTLMDDVNDAFEDDHFAAVERMAIESSLQHGVSFVFVTPGDPILGEPEVIVSARTALEGTAEVDPRTNRVLNALEVISGVEVLLYMPGMTLSVERLDRDWMVTREYGGVANFVPCVPYIWGWSLSRPMGRSRVTRPLMGYIDSGVRTMLRQEVTAEFFSAPQRTLLGAEEEHFTDPKTGERISPLDALIGGVWALPNTRDEETGDLIKPTLDQLQQASMQPHSEQLRTIGLMVSSELSIPVAYLGIIHDNPSSADAILASESDMVAMVEYERDLSYGISRQNLARTIIAVKYGGITPAMAAELRGLKAHFANAGTPTRAARADAAQKYAMTFPEGDPEVAMEEYGLTKSQIERNLEYAKRMNAGGMLAQLLGTGSPDGAPTEADAAKAEAEVLGLKATALGTLRRAGVDADVAAQLVGLENVRFIPGQPITIKAPGDD